MATLVKFIDKRNVVVIINLDLVNCILFTHSGKEYAIHFENTVFYFPVSENKEIVESLCR